MISNQDLSKEGIVLAALVNLVVSIKANGLQGHLGEGCLEYADKALFESGWAVTKGGSYGKLN